MKKLCSRNIDEEEGEGKRLDQDNPLNNKENQNKIPSSFMRYPKGFHGYHTDLRTRRKKRDVFWKLLPRDIEKKTQASFLSLFAKELTININSDQKSKYAIFLCKRLKSLKAFNIEFENRLWNPTLTRQGVLQIYRSMRLLKNLKNVKLDYSRAGSIGLTEAQLSGSTKILKFFKNLIGVALEFSDWKEFSNQALSNVLRPLESRRSLQKLELQLRRCPKLTSHGLVHVGKAILNHRSLKEIQLSFYDCKNIQGPGVVFLINTCKENKSLDTIDLDFSHCKQLTDYGISTTGKQLATNSSVENFSCKVSGVPISDKGLSDFSFYFRSFQSLKKIALDFSQCHYITNQGLVYLGEDLSSLSFLQTIDLNFSYTNRQNISGEGVSKLLSSLIPLLSLENISLYFDSGNLSDEALSDMGRSIGLFPSLKKINLNFSSCEKTTDQGLSLLTKNMESSTTLQEISLNFPSCDQLTENRFSSLSSNLGSIQSLQSIRLNFAVSHNFYGHEIKNFCKDLAGLKNFRKLALSLHNCYEFTDQGLMNLTSDLPLLKSLQSFSLNICSSCHKTGSEKARESLCFSLGSMTSLKEVFLLFRDLDITNKEVTNWRQVLRFVPNFYIDAYSEF